MNKSTIDNPDLHLKIDVNQKVIKAVLEENLDVEIIVITDLIDFDFYEKKLNYWVHLYKCDDNSYPITISVYNIVFTIENAKTLAPTLNCEINTDFESALNEHERQLIQPNGSVTVVNSDTLFY